MILVRPKILSLLTLSFEFFDIVEHIPFLNLLESELSFKKTN